MKKILTIFLQAVITLMGIVAFVIMIRFPLLEGRAENLDLFSIYFDPFILYMYAASITFFLALYQVFRLFGYIGQNKIFTQNSVSALNNIKYYAILLFVLIVMAGLYIKIFHRKDDDPVGFLAVCTMAAFVSILIAAAAAIFEKIFQYGVDIQLENEELKKGFNRTL